MRTEIYYKELDLILAEAGVPQEHHLRSESFIKTMMKNRTSPQFLRTFVHCTKLISRNPLAWFYMDSYKGGAI